jgi:hypothetical protein
MAKKEEWMVEVERNGHAMNMCRICEVEFLELEDAMVKWYELCENQGDLITRALMLEKASHLCKLLKIPEEKLALSVGWLGSFKKCHGLQKRKLNGEAGSIDVTTAEAEWVRLCPILSKFKPEDRYNADESGFFYCQLLNYALGSRDLLGKKLDKQGSPSLWEATKLAQISCLSFSLENLRSHNASTAKNHVHSA